MSGMFSYGSLHQTGVGLDDLNNPFQLSDSLSTKLIAASFTTSNPLRLFSGIIFPS